MKILINLLMLVSIYAYAQERHGKISYKVVLDSEDYINLLKNDSTITEKVKQGRIQHFSAKRPVNFILYFKEKEGVYKPEVDFETKIKSGYTLNVTSVIAGEASTYYTNIQTGEKLFKSYRTPGILVNLEEMSWEVTGQTKIIGEYTCFKAIGNLSPEQYSGIGLLGPVVAWYTPEVPLSFGIKNFNGLPGLTLELIAPYEVGTMFYSATEINFNPEKEIVIKKPNGKQHMSEMEYKDYIKNLRPN